MGVVLSIDAIVGLIIGGIVVVGGIVTGVVFASKNKSNSGGGGGGGGGGGSGHNNNIIASLSIDNAKVLSVAVSPSGDQILTGYTNGKARLWMQPWNAPVATINTIRQPLVTELAIAEPKDTEKLLLIKEQNEDTHELHAYLYNKISKQTIKEFYYGNKKTVKSSIAMTPNGSHIIWAHKTKDPIHKSSVTVFNRRKGSFIGIGASETGLEDLVASMAVHNNGIAVLIAFDSGDVAIYGIHSGGSVRQIEMVEQYDKPAAIAMSPDGSWVLTGVDKARLLSCNITLRQDFNDTVRIFLAGNIRYRF